jgi:DNA invertase Pin-like site-specific DNA recombinase
MDNSTNKPIINLKRAVSYLRVSTRDQAERDGEVDGYSIPAQREANKSKALSMGAVVIKEFADKGASAKYANRPGLQDMLEYVKDPDNEVSYVIVHKLDRLARNREDDVNITKTFKDAGVKLVSTSEGVDDSPAGTMLHGILATMAEFYSKNLAKEALKGMSQKVKKGGTVGKAPIGYKNVRYVNNEGREVRTVEIDTERAPFVTEAFNMYATGKWSVCNLAAELAGRGFTTAPAPRKPSEPMNEKSLNRMLQNPYYLGKVKFQGVYHDGKHEKLINEITFRKVQEIMKDHKNGERKRVHNHYLKSTVYCGECGSRLIIQVSRSQNGVHYPYFTCIGRQSKRTKCQQKAVLIYEGEDQIAEYYKKIQFTDEYCEQLKKQMLADITEQKKQSAKERDELHHEQDRLQNRQKN